MDNLELQKILNGLEYGIENFFMRLEELEEQNSIIIKHFIAKIPDSDFKIEIYPNDHNPAHFHIVSKKRNINARFEINVPFGFISHKYGNITNKDIKIIQHFLNNSKTTVDYLKSEYERFHKGK